MKYIKHFELFNIKNPFKKKRMNVNLNDYKDEIQDCFRSVIDEGIFNLNISAGQIRLEKYKDNIYPLKFNLSDVYDELKFAIEYLKPILGTPECIGLGNVGRFNSLEEIPDWIMDDYYSPKNKVTAAVTVVYYEINHAR